jgi:hypothetical protein
MNQAYAPPVHPVEAIQRNVTLKCKNIGLLTDVQKSIEHEKFHYNKHFWCSHVYETENGRNHFISIPKITWAPK